MSITDAYCCELSHHFPLWPHCARTPACLRAYIGDNGICRVSARQYAAVAVVALMNGNNMQAVCERTQLVSVSCV